MNKRKNLIITIGMIVGVGVIVYLGIRFLNQYTSNTKAVYPSSVASTEDIAIPDSAVGFGYKCLWLAVKTDNKKRIAEILKLKNVTDCNWKVGVDKAYNGSVFITPTIDGWTLACGLGLPTGDDKASIEEVKTILQTLSKEFGEAQFFCTHRVVEYHCWIKAVNGQVERVYSYLGEAFENILVEGNPTEFEKTLNHW
jgi:hypothetical protein